MRTELAIGISELTRLQMPLDRSNRFADVTATQAARPEWTGAVLAERGKQADRTGDGFGCDILGIGSDLANIDRIAGVLDRFGDRFRNRVFTPVELARANRRPHEAATLAKRWAAKEACSKALGTGLAMGIAWRDMAVTNLASGQPHMALTGWAAERLAAMTPPGHAAHVHVTLTDDHPWAQAFVVIEAFPATL